MSALETVKQAGEKATLDRIRDSGLVEYGIFPEKLADKVERIKNGHTPFAGPLIAAGALNNEDTDHMLLCLVREQPEKVLNGLRILGYLLGAEELVLYLPEGEHRLIEFLSAKACESGGGIRVEEGPVDLRHLRGGMVSHIETLIALVDTAEGGWKQGAYLAVRTKNAGKTTETKPFFVPYGTKLNRLIPDDVRQIKAVQFGGHLYMPSVLETQITDMTVLGSGVITLYGGECCMVAAAEEDLEAKRRAGCGKCTFCREGIVQIYTRIHEITNGKGDYPGLDIMKEIGEAMPYSCLCSAGQTGAGVVLDSLELFQDEYEQHIKKKKCPAGQCPAFINMYIDPDKCTGCGSCIPVCPQDCIEGLPGYIHIIEEIDCTKCGKCMAACDGQAIVRTVKRMPAIPDRLTRVGRFKRY